MRLSIVASSPETALDFPFSYREQFKYRWTEHHLLSTLLSLPDHVLNILSWLSSSISFFPVTQKTHTLRAWQNYVSPAMCPSEVQQNSYFSLVQHGIILGCSLVRTQSPSLGRASKSICLQRPVVPLHMSLNLHQSRPYAGFWHPGILRCRPMLFIHVRDVLVQLDLPNLGSIHQAAEHCL